MQCKKKKKKMNGESKLRKYVNERTPSPNKERAYIVSMKIYILCMKFLVHGSILNNITVI
jgi:hypothetical protein